MSTHTVSTRFGGNVEVESFPNGRTGVNVDNGISETFIALEPGEANELAIVLNDGNSTLDYEEALDIAFQRLSLAASVTDNDALADALLSLGLGFAIDSSPATREVVKALVGAL